MRIVNRLLAFLVALALAGVCVIIIVEVIAARSGAGPLIVHWRAILDWAQRNTWKATSVELTCSITAAAGLLLLLPQLYRRRASRVRIDPDPATSGGRIDAALTSKGVTVTIRGAVAEVEGIASSRVKVGRRRITVKALSTALEGEAMDDLWPKVDEVVTQELAGLRLHRARRVKVRVNGRGSRSTKRPGDGSDPTHTPPQTRVGAHRNAGG
jgi:hypothetical protein